MMDETAITKIQDLATAAANLVGQRTQEFGLDRPVVALPSDLKIHDLERYMDTRSRFRGCLNTISVDAFADYTSGQDDNPVCFVDGEKMVARAIFDMGTVEAPGHMEHTAVLTMKETAPYSALLARNGMNESQRATAEWLEDWREFLKATNDKGEDIEVPKAITAVRNLSLETKQGKEYREGNFHSTRTAMEEIEAKGKEDNLPAYINFNCVPYEGLEERTFYMRLSLTGQHGHEPGFVLRIVRLERAQEEIVHEFRDLLNSKFLGTDVITYIGKFSG